MEVVLLNWLAVTRPGTCRPIFVKEGLHQGNMIINMSKKTIQKMTCA